jgi:hypothetical protein
MVARREVFPTPLSWQTQVTPPSWGNQNQTKSATWSEKLRSPQTIVLVALGMGMVLGWIIKRSR